jgi:hypothetical protein
MALRDSAFIARFLDSEEFSCNKSFSKEFVHRDAHNPEPTTLTITNSDIGMTGKASRLNYNRPGPA